jgi:putative inorganic carbon (HCO3(-)) transporter
VPSTSLAVDRYVVAAAVVLTCVLFTAKAADPVNVIKLTTLLLSALALAGTSVYRAVRYRVVCLPRGPVLWVTASLAIALAVSAALAPVAGRAVYGAYGRNSGLLAYLSAIALFVATLRVAKPPQAHVLVGGITFAGLFTASYGLLQHVGIDPVNWNNPFNPIIAALGNPNFAAGYLGIAASVTAGAALWRGWGAPWRALAASTSVLCLLATSLSASAQGPIAAAGGLFVVAVGWVLGLPTSPRRLGLAGLAAAALAGIGTLLVGAVSKAGPAARVFADVGSEARVFYWGAALEMFRDKPVVGVGLDQYGTFWGSSRSVASVDYLGGPSFSDAAHSVPLQVLAQGGLVLGLAYGALLVLIGFTLIRGLLTLSDGPRMLLASVGGGWAAYQVQSFVSIDQVPLIVLHFVLAGGVLAVAGRMQWRELRLPGAATVAPPPGKKSRSRKGAAVTARPRHRPASGLDAGILAAAAAALVFAAWLALHPLRADMALAAADRQLSRGDGNQALEHYERATRLLPEQPLYWERLGAFYTQVDRPSLAAAAYAEARQRDGGNVNALRNGARLAEERGEVDQARRLYTILLDSDPVNPESVVAAATFELRHSGAERARRLLEEAEQKLPPHAELLAALGDARAVLGAEDAARSAYSRALRIDPGEETAARGLARLS